MPKFPKGPRRTGSFRDTPLTWGDDASDDSEAYLSESFVNTSDRSSELEGPFLLREAGEAEGEWEESVALGEADVPSVVPEAFESEQHATEEAFEGQEWQSGAAEAGPSGGIQLAYSPEPSHLTAGEITTIFGPVPAVAALHWLLSSPNLHQATLATLQGGAARRSVRIHGSDMPVPHYLRFLSRLFREAAEQSEAQVADETAWRAETEAAPEPDLPLRYQRRAGGEAEAGSRTSPAYVRWIQQALNQLGGARLVEDGRIGPITRAAVVSFQRTHGLKPDGIVGPTTEAALAAASNVQPPSAGAPRPSPATPRAVYANWSDGDDRRKGRNPRDQVIEGRLFTTGVVDDLSPHVDVSAMLLERVAFLFRTSRSTVRV